jgi:hypothetical protein
MNWKHVNTRSSYCVSMVLYIKYGGPKFGTLSNFATLFWHNTTKILPTPALNEETESY